MQSVKPILSTGNIADDISTIHCTTSKLEEYIKSLKCREELFNCDDEVSVIYNY